MIPRKANRIAKKWPQRYYNDLKTRLRKAKRRKERIPPLAKTRGDRTGGDSPGVAGGTLAVIRETWRANAPRTGNLVPRSCSRSPLGARGGEDRNGCWPAMVALWLQPRGQVKATADGHETRGGGGERRAGSTPSHRRPHPRYPQLHLPCGGPRVPTPRRGRGGATLRPAFLRRRTFCSFFLIDVSNTHTNRTT